MTIVGTVDRSKEHIEIACYVKAEERGHGCLIGITLGYPRNLSNSQLVLLGGSAKASDARDVVLSINLITDLCNPEVKN